MKKIEKMIREHRKIAGTGRLDYMRNKNIYKIQEFVALEDVNGIICNFNITALKEEYDAISDKSCDRGMELNVMLKFLDPKVKIDGDKAWNIMHKIFKGKGICDKINPNEILTAFKDENVINGTY